MLKIPLFLVLCVFVNQSLQGRRGCPCPKTQVWKEEGIRCANCNNYQVVKCGLIQEPGCFCPDGKVYLNAQSSTCVSPNYCPQCNNCSNNATTDSSDTDSDQSSSSSDSSSSDEKKRCNNPYKVYSECASVCPRTCSNWWEPETCQACRPGCTCRNNLVLNAHNHCVRVSKCPKPVCKDPRREFKECGSACPVSCSNLNETSIVCTKQCVARCFCKSPYVEDGNGNCVKPSECSQPVCLDPNRHYESCGIACPESCFINKTLNYCTTDCLKGCFCNEGLVEDNYGNCIAPSDCPTAETCTDPDKVYKKCGSACPPTCDNRDNSCTDDCVEGCFCRDGLIDDGYGKCVAPENCDICPDPNRYYTDCGTACPITCKNWWYYDHIVCTEQCVPGCVCRDGLVEDGNGNCVETTYCPQPVCNDPNRQFLECGSSCPDTCDNINNPDRVCTQQCLIGCFCKYPLVEDGHGNCINRTQCSNSTCKDPNRYYTDCGSYCPQSCTNRCKNYACPAMCVAGCFCRPELIDDGKGNCIAPRNCPADACKYP